MKYFFFVFVALSIFCAGVGESWARKWKPSPTELAQDYLTLNHAITRQEHVLLIWLAPQYFENIPANAVAREMAGSYSLVGIVHFTISNMGEWQFKEVTELTLDHGTAASLAPLAAADLPPAVPAFVGAFKSVLGAGLGKLGEGLEIFVFDAAGFDSCAKNLLHVNNLSESYAFETPLPGC